MSGRLATLLANNSMTIWQLFAMDDDELLAIDGAGTDILDEVRVMQMGRSLSANVLRCG